MRRDYPPGARARFTKGLARLDEGELWDLVGIFNVPTEDREEWDREALHQRLVDFVYAEQPTWT